MLFTKFSQRLHQILASIVFVVGIAVMIGWILQNPAIIQLGPDLSPMVFNTGLCLVALATGIAFANAKTSLISKVSVGVVVVISGVTLVQYIFAIDLGVDTFFNKPFYSIGMPFPGRMAVSTATCLLILALSCCQKKEKYTFQMLSATGASLVLGFSLIGSLSYFLGFNSEYGWGSFSRMALHTSLSLTMLALATLWFLRLQVGKVSIHDRALTPFFVVVTGVLTTILIWQLLVLRDQERNKKLTQIRVESLKAHLDNVFTPLEKSLGQMSRRFSAGAYSSEKMWKVDAEGFFAEFRGLHRLFWADQEGVIRWAYPASGGGTQLLNTKVWGTSKDLQARFMELTKGHRVSLSNIIEFRTGGKGFVLFVPIHVEAKYEGVVAAAVLSEPFFNEVADIPGYDLVIYEQGREVFRKGTPDPVFARDWKVNSSYRELGVHWEIEVVPSDAVIRENTSNLPGVVLLFGVSVSLLLGIALRFYNLAKESERAAKEAYDFKTAGMNSVPLLIISLDKNTVIREMNKTAEELLEYKNEEVVGQATPLIFHDMNEVHEVRTKMERELGYPIALGADFISAADKLRMTRASEWTQISKSGKRYVMTMSMNPIRNENGEITGYLEILEDVTELREKEKILKDQELKMLTSARLASLGEMAAGIAHEINNPLAIISGHVGVLRKTLQHKGLGDDQELQKKTDSIESVVQRIAKIVRGLRTYSRESEASGDEWVSIESLVDDTLAFCHERFKLEGVELSAVLEPQLKIKARSYQISQVLLNLLNNALDAVQASKYKKVVIEARRGKEGIEISVSDTGPGVPYNMREKIMEPFFTTKEVGQGVGLGLSISQGIIQSHNGKLYLDEASAKTRFVIWFPPQDNL
ncbi:MAG: PAS domain S-box protein [Bdellovibrio sp.]|nr:PAS domain S-box protein [Bdellovibrio sp.]